MSMSTKILRTNKQKMRVIQTPNHFEVPEKSSYCLCTNSYFFNIPLVVVFAILVVIGPTVAERFVGF